MPDETPAGTTATPAAQPAAAAPVKQEQVVPFDRFAAVMSERDTAREALAQALEARAAAESKAKALERADAKATEFRTQAERLEGKLANTRAVVGFGIVESELIDAIEGHWSTLPADAKPASLSDMLKDWREGNEGKPALDRVPLLLRPHLEAKWAPAPAATAAATTQQRPAPAGHRAAGSTGPQGSQTLTPDQINDLARQVQQGKITMTDYQTAIRAARRVAG